MVTATDFSCSAPTGATMRSGRAADSGLPAWLAGAAVNDWVSIAGTAFNNTLINAWCGMCLTPTGEVLVPLLGGHQDGADTSISSLLLSSDAPTWTKRIESLPPEMMNFSRQTTSPYSVESPGPIYPYCKDDTTPSARHTRYTPQYCQQNNRIMLMGSPSLYGANGESVESNGFDLATNTWDPPGTWISMSSTSNQGVAIDDLGNIWCRSSKWSQATNTIIPVAGSFNYKIAAFDTLRRQIFMLSMGDGQGASLGQGVWAKTVSEDGVTARAITFNTSDEYTEFAGQILDYSAMEYDPIRDRFLYYYGKGISQGVVYVATPNSGTVWDISKLAQGPGSALPPAPTSAGTNGRFKYVAAYDGILLLPQSSSPLYFMKLS